MKKKILLALISISMTFGLSACTTKQDNSMEKGKKVLVAYFSWSGNTKKVAEYIAEKTNADMFRIESQTS